MSESLAQYPGLSLMHTGRDPCHFTLHGIVWHILPYPKEELQGTIMDSVNAKIRDNHPSWMFRNLFSAKN